MEAASILGRIAALIIRNHDNSNSEFPARAFKSLLDFYRDACYDDSEQGTYRPLDFSDLAEYHVRLSVLKALARARSSTGFSPDLAVDTLLDVLRSTENRSSRFDSVGVAPLTSPSLRAMKRNFRLLSLPLYDIVRKFMLVLVEERCI
jgi:hypothetical protein